MTKRFLMTLTLVTLAWTAAPLGASAQTPPPATDGATNTNATQLQWYTNYAQAVQAAQKEHKPLLLFFTGSDWCGWCKKMHQEVFSSPEFAQSVGKNFVFVEIDFPMNSQLPAEQAQQNNMLKQKFGITGFPTVVLLNSDEGFIAETGYRPGGGKTYADYLNQLVQ